MKYILLIIVPFLCYSQTVWDGETITFSKANNTDFTQEIHQDRITADVWLTRGNGGGLFNIRDESYYYESVSPSYTLWAIGETSDNDLVFDNFKDFYGPSGNKPPINTQIVLKLTQGTSHESDDIHIDLTFTTWTSGGSGQNGGGGGFSYTRSTDPSFNVELKNTVDFFVYPNPTQGFVHTNQKFISQISVYDIKGQQIMISNASSVDLSAFKNGIYILNLYRSDTKNWVTRHIIKNHKI
jgi:hypothetical protein